MNVSFIFSPNSDRMGNTGSHRLLDGDLAAALGCGPVMPVVFSNELSP